MTLKTVYLAHEKWFLFLISFGLYALSYFFMAHLAENRETYSVMLSFEQNIPFVPFFAIFYLSFYIIAFLPFFLIKDVKALRKVAACYLPASLACCIIYLLFPVEMVRQTIIPHNFWEQLVKFIYFIDQPYNCFPSLHVFSSFMSGFAIWLFDRKKGAFILLWAGMIAISTLFVKQHYVLDIIAGFLVALICYLILKKFLK